VVNFGGKPTTQHQDIVQVRNKPPAAIDAPSSSSSGLFAGIQATLPAFPQIFSDFQDVANAEGRLPTAMHKAVHHIKTVGPPATALFGHLNAAKLAAANAEFSKVEILENTTALPHY
jgi:hypothetical protein